MIDIIIALAIIVAFAWLAGKGVEGMVEKDRGDSDG